MARTPKPPKLKYYAGLNVFQALIVTLFGAPLIVFLIIPYLLGGGLAADMVKPWIPATILAVVAFLAVTPQFWRFAINLFTSTGSQWRQDWDEYSDDEKYEQILQAIAFVIIWPLFIGGMLAIVKVTLWVVKHTRAFLGSQEHPLVYVAFFATLFGLIFLVVLIGAVLLRIPFLVVWLEKFVVLFDGKFRPSHRRNDSDAAPVGISQPSEKPRQRPSGTATNETDFAFDPNAFKESPAPKQTPIDPARICYDFPLLCAMIWHGNRHAHALEFGLA